MSQQLTYKLEAVRQAYIKEMQGSDGHAPLLTAERLCHEYLFLETDELARVLGEDASLLAARAGDLINNPQEAKNPSAGVIISSNLVTAAVEGLLSIAVEHEWLEADEEGNILVSEEELAQREPVDIQVDYSISPLAQQNMHLSGPSHLSRLFMAAEKAYLESLASEAHDAYQLAMQVASDYAVFAPEDLAPLIEENPLLLGLRADDMVDDEAFSDDPPAGIIISCHLTHMLIQQLLSVAAEEGALPQDGNGLTIVSDEEEDNPTVH